MASHGSRYSELMTTSNTHPRTGCSEWSRPSSPQPDPFPVGDVDRRVTESGAGKRHHGLSDGYRPAATGQVQDRDGPTAIPRITLLLICSVIAAIEQVSGCQQYLTIIKARITRVTILEAIRDVLIVTQVIHKRLPGRSLLINLNVRHVMQTTMCRTSTKIFQSQVS